VQLGCLLVQIFLVPLIALTLHPLLLVFTLSSHICVASIHSPGSPRTCPALWWSLTASLQGYNASCCTIRRSMRRILGKGWVGVGGGGDRGVLGAQMLAAGVVDWEEALARRDRVWEGDEAMRAGAGELASALWPPPDLAIVCISPVAVSLGLGPSTLVSSQSAKSTVWEGARLSQR